ncbi:DNA primase [Halobacteriovorax marinus]|uniref:DNA primase n=1 Tax=Halobacteriovorax marinus TaxID=97084 RepID=A0A1Y5FAY0_9BACT|nr:DNA primase [Halobacteriovorax marinus]
MSLKDLKEKIVTEIPITAIVGGYIPITRKGTTTLAVCPFHDDHKPSMYVTDDKKMYKCFACGAGGNAIDFVVNFKNLDFVDALKEICNSQGLSFDDYYQKKAKPPKLEMAEKILTKSSQLYCKLATTGSYEKYTEFIKNRDLNAEIAKTYSLGYAPKDSKLTSYLSSIPNEKERSFALSVAQEIGLIKVDQKDGKSHYDTFRDRIIFPIWDQYGQVVGYTSRAVFDYQKAKYMNSKESFVFNKKHILYGLHLAKSSIRSKDACILVEGNMDQIALYNKGFTNSVAVQGVALGDSSLRNLKGMTSNFILSLDNDQAGWSASERINRQCLEAGITPRFLDLSPHKDPDDFLQSEGSVELQKRIDSAKVFIDEQLDRAMPEKMPEILDSQLQLLDKCFKILSPLKESLSATERAAQIAKRIGLKSDSSQIINNYKQFLSGEQAASPPTHFAEQPPESLMTESFHEEIPYEELHYLHGEETLLSVNAISKIETTLLTEIIKHPECLTNDKIRDLLDFVSSDEVKNYIKRLKEIFYEIDESEFVSIVSNLTENGSFSNELKETISQALRSYRPVPLEEDVVKIIIFDIKKKLQELELRLLKDEIKERRKACTTNEEINELMKELLEIEKKLVVIKSQRHK